MAGSDGAVVLGLLRLSSPTSFPLVKVADIFNPPLKVGFRNTNHKGARMLLLTLKVLLAIATPVAIVSVVVIAAAWEQHYLNRKEALKCTK